MNEFHLLAARIDQHMQRLSIQGVDNPDSIINYMMGYTPDLHRIWVRASDDELIELSNEFPGFYRYALIMEEASEAESKKESRPYDGIEKLSEQHRQIGSQLMSTAATLEHGYGAFIGCGNLAVFQPQVSELNKLHRQWLSDLEDFKTSLRAQHIEPKTIEAISEVFERLAKRIKTLAR